MAGAMTINYQWILWSVREIMDSRKTSFGQRRSCVATRRIANVTPKETLKNLLVSSTSSGGGTLSCDGNDEEQADEPKIAVDDRLL